MKLNVARCLNGSASTGRQGKAPSHHSETSGRPGFEEIFENSNYHLLSAADVGRVLNISPKTVYKLARQQRILKAALPGRVVRFRPEDIARIRNRMRIAESEV